MLAPARYFVHGGVGQLSASLCGATYGVERRDASKSAIEGRTGLFRCALYAVDPRSALWPSRGGHNTVTVKLYHLRPRVASHCLSLFEHTALGSIEKKGRPSVLNTQLSGGLDKKDLSLSLYGGEPRRHRQTRARGHTQGLRNDRGTVIGVAFFNLP